MDQSQDLQYEEFDESHRSTAITRLVQQDRSFIVMMFLYTKELFKFPVFVYMFFLYTLGNGSIVLMGSMVNIICTHFGYKSFYGSIVAAGVVILGLCSSILYSLFLINRKDQGYIMSFFFVGCVVLLVIAMASLIHEYLILFT